MQFIRQLIEQRKLKIEFELINEEKNLAKKIFNAKFKIIVRGAGSSLEGPS